MTNESKKKLKNILNSGINQTYRGDHSAIYANIKSHYTPETNLICQLYIENYFELSENEIVRSKFWNAVNTVLKGKFIVFNEYTREKERSKINNSSFHLRIQKKKKSSNKNQSQINKIEINREKSMKQKN